MIKVKQRLKIEQVIAAVALPLALGALAAYLNKDGIAMFRSVSQPPLSPPAWLFPVVWTALYILMGLASYLVLSAPVSPVRKERALSAYALSLALNFVWPFIFFGMELYIAAFLLLLLLWLAAGISALMFRCISDVAGLMMLPYLLWLGFAAYLNLGVALLN